MNLTLDMPAMALAGHSPEDLADAVERYLARGFPLPRGGTAVPQSCTVNTIAHQTAARQTQSRVTQTGGLDGVAAMEFLALMGLLIALANVFDFSAAFDWIAKMVEHWPRFTLGLGRWL